MSELRFISGEAALRNFIEQVREDVDRQLDERKVNASGALKRSNRTEVVMGMGSIGSTEVTWLYNGGTRRNPHRYPLGHTWYRMGESRDNATTIYDEIGSNNLTLVNMDASNYVTP